MQPGNIRDGPGCGGSFLKLPVVCPPGATAGELMIVYP